MDEAISIAAKALADHIDAEIVAKLRANSLETKQLMQRNLVSKSPKTRESKLTVGALQ